MNLSRFSFISLLTLVFALTTPAQIYAQEDSDTPSDVNTARLQVKISQLEEQIRKLQGMVEQVSYDNRQLKAQIDKSNNDIDYRISALEKAQQSAAQQPQQQAQPQNNDQPASDSGKLHPVEAAPADDTSENAAPLPKFPNSRAHYNYAFKLLNQGDKYAEAGNAFAAFTKSYPKDPLIGNAYYWLGETYYVRRDYVKAADNFRQGYEAMPTGPKAADNLLNLAKSLNAIKKPKEACIVLKQVVVKFGSSSNSMKSRAEQDMNTFGCNN